MSTAEEESESVAACPFCRRDTLTGILAETDHFFVLADHAPLIEGHSLIVPKRHYACYGALASEVEPEFLALKQRVTRILTGAYRAPVYFEHGVFRQTVYHAHLHAMPFGPVDIGMRALADGVGRPIRRLDDLRDWFATRGHYFYIEPPAHDGALAEAAAFPPDMTAYFGVLGALRDAAGATAGWAPQPARRAMAGPKIATLAEHWRRLDV